VRRLLTYWLPPVIRAALCRRKRVLVLLILLMAGYRASLLDRGALAFVDETLYFTSVIALQAISEGDLTAASRAIADARGRQGAAIALLPVAALQAIPSAFGVTASNPRSLMIPTGVNVLLSLITLVIVFQLCLRLTNDEDSSLAAVTLYALLVNTNLYIRHVLPYELALTVGALAMWVAITRAPTIRTAALAGVLAAALVTCYSGYYLLAAVIAIAFVGRGWVQRGARRAFALALVFGLAAALVFAIIEAVCRPAGVSYLASSRALGQTITMGSFDEGWTFLPEYLIRVERWSGIVLLGGFIIWAAQAAKRWRRGVPLPVDVWVAAAALAWVAQAVLAAELRRIVFYGRLIHPWMIFLTFALASVVASVRQPRARRITQWGIVVAALVSFIPSARDYVRLAYPSDVLYALGIDSRRIVPEHWLCELDPGTPYASPGPLDRRTGAPYASASDYVLVNFCQTFGPGRRAVEAVDHRRPLLFEGPHWLTFPAYTYEGFKPEARDDMIARRYQVRAYGPLSQR
jgi:hypothetical protein